ncbi:hypothetical protein [Lysobacter gummosus]
MTSRRLCPGRVTAVGRRRRLYGAGCLLVVAVWGRSAEAETSSEE